MERGKDPTYKHQLTRLLSILLRTAACIFITITQGLAEEINPQFYRDEIQSFLIPLDQHYIELIDKLPTEPSQSLCDLWYDHSMKELRHIPFQYLEKEHSLRYQMKDFIPENDPLLPKLKIALWLNNEQRFANTLFLTHQEEPYLHTDLLTQGGKSSATNQQIRSTSFILIGKGIKMFPENLFTLNDLTWIYLSNPQMSSGIPFIPSRIKEIKTLGHLILRDNELVALPKEIGECPNLIRIDLESNKIKSLVDSSWNFHPWIQSLLDHKRFRELNLKGNPLDEISLYALNNLKEDHARKIRT